MAGFNLLTGSIPTQVAGLGGLVQVAFGKCKLFVMRCISPVSDSLLCLFPADNMLTGTIPSEFSRSGENMATIAVGKTHDYIYMLLYCRLCFLLLVCCVFTMKLTFLSAAFNFLTGRVPTQFQQLSNLRQLMLCT